MSPCVRVAAAVFLFFLGTARLFAAETAFEPGGGNYDIAFQAADIKSALRFLANVGGFNLIVPEDIDGTVTVAFRGVGVADAVISILKANGLEYASENGVLRIGKGERFADTGEDLKSEEFPLRYATASNLTTQLQALLSKRGSAVADDRTNTLVVKDTSANLDEIKHFVDSIDIKDKQVLIEAKIIEASRDFSRDLGVQWGINSDGTNSVDVSGLTPVGTSQQTNPLNQNLGFITPTSGVGISFGKLPGGTNLEVQLQAAEQKGKARLISSPSIVTTNGQAAHIRSGQTLLIRTNSGVVISNGTTTTTTGTTGTGTTTSNLQQIQTGIELNVTPQVSLGEHIKMVIEAISSQADFSRQIDGIPVISDNNATTTVLIKDKETTVIGGLVQNNNTLTRRGVPYFSQVPLVGSLFKSKSRKINDAQLIIFIKPTILTAAASGMLPEPVHAPAVLEPTVFKQSLDEQAAEEEAAKKAGVPKHYRSRKK